MSLLRIALAVVVLALHFASPASAQARYEPEADAAISEPLRWVRIGITEADTLWFDPETARSTEPGVYTVWVLESRGRGATLPTGESYSVVRELSDFDCVARRSRRRELTFLTHQESLVKSYSWTPEEGEWREPIPGSDAAFILREVCERVQ